MRRETVKAPCALHGTFRRFDPKAAALSHAREARTIARQINSDRQLRRLGRLILPPGIAA